MSEELNNDQLHKVNGGANNAKHLINSINSLKSEFEYYCSCAKKDLNYTIIMSCLNAGVGYLKDNNFVSAKYHLEDSYQYITKLASNRSEIFSYLNVFQTKVKNIADSIEI